MTEEDIAIAKRRTQAIGMIVLGILIAAFGVAAFITGMFGIPKSYSEQYSTGAGVCAILVPIGFGLVLYGSYYFEKSQHVEWTKQALREYDESKRGIGRLHSNRHYDYCPICEQLLHKSTSKFCEHCGAKLNEITLAKSDLISEKKELSKLIEKLDERVSLGNISENTYKELRSKYEEKLRQTEGTISQRIAEHRCVRCGSLLTQNANFCHKCGAKTIGMNENQEN